MSRRKKAPAAENHERWLISYADFITLLFAFFVVMFASSQTDKNKAKQVSEAVQKAFDGGIFPPTIRQMLGGKARGSGNGEALVKGPTGQNIITSKNAKEVREAAQVVELLPSLQFLNKELDQEIRAGKLKVTMGPRGLVVTLSQATFFPSGEDSLDPQTYSTIEKIAAAIRPLPNSVRMEGHTDAIPIHNARFRSNWELSADRGIAMLEILSDKYGIDRTRMAVAGYGDTVPLVPNDSGEGRARNRRVDIVILSQQGQTREPEKPVKGQPPVKCGAKNR